MPETPVSCLCPTYGRPRLLAEAVECFLRQDYKGPTELIVLNDLAEQKIIIDHVSNPERSISVLNLDPLDSLGEVRNRLVAAARYELLALWDDDDIYLPWHLSGAISRINSGYIKRNKAFYSEKNQILKVDQNLFHSQSIYRKDTWTIAGGYPAIGCGEDAVFEDRVTKNGVEIQRLEIDLSDISYIYRWDTDSLHLSGWGIDMKDEIPGKNKMHCAWMERMNDGKESLGTVTIQPHWNRDYVDDVAAFLDKGDVHKKLRNLTGA